VRHQLELRKSAAMRRASQRQLPEMNTLSHHWDGRRPLSPPSLARSGERAMVAPRDGSS
jgi:hypothetical protein